MTERDNIPFDTAIEQVTKYATRAGFLDGVLTAVLKDLKAMQGQSCNDEDYQRVIERAEATMNKLNIPL